LSGLGIPPHIRDDLANRTNSKVLLIGISLNDFVQGMVAPGRGGGVATGGRVSYCMTMSRAEKASAVLTVRIGADLTRSLAREARRRRKTKSEVAREILAAGLSGERGGLDAEQEARRQSLLVSRRRSEREVLEFIEEAADRRGWR
jgi:hypothetical protein